MSWKIIPILMLIMITFCISYVTCSPDSNHVSYLKIIGRGSTLGQEISQTNDLKSKIIANRKSIEAKVLSFISNLRFENSDIFTNYLKTAMKSSVKQTFLENAMNYNVSDLCLNQTVSLLEGLMELQPWALKMMDAGGKPSGGLMNLNPNWMGSFDECMAVVSTTSSTKNQFKGRYCTLVFPMGHNFQISGEGGALSKITKVGLNVGMCFPDGCSNQDTLALVNTAIDLLPLGENTTRIVSAESSVCEMADVPYHTGAIVVLVVISLFALLMVVATLYDTLIQWRKWLHKDQTQHSINYDTRQLIGEALVDTKPGTCGKLLLAFSMTRNGTKIFETQQNPDSLTAVHGIRFISMTWVILGHTLAFGMLLAENTLTFIPTMIKRWTFLVILNGTMSVDTFFTLSGILVSYLTLKELKKHNGKYNWGLYYFHRFLRLTPPYMLVMMVYVPLSPYFLDGPRYPQEGFETNFCKDTWWTNLLYVNNLVRVDNMCMAWTWYLANEMQFHLVSPLMLLPLYFFPSIGALVCLVFVLACFVTTGVISFVHGMPPSLFGWGILPGNNKLEALKKSLGGISEYFNDYYITPYCRIGPYVVGIFTGFMLYKIGRQCKISRYASLSGWLIAAGFACVILYGLYHPLNGHPFSTEVSALYNATSRTVWGTCVAWVVFVCATNNGGFINTLLSWKALVPLSRLTYCAYLVHPIIMYTYYFSRRTPVHLTDFITIIHFLGFLVLAYMVSFVVSLAFESPFMEVEKLVLKKSTPSTSK